MMAMRDAAEEPFPCAAPHACLPHPHKSMVSCRWAGRGKALNLG